MTMRQEIQRMIKAERMLADHHRNEIQVQLNELKELLERTMAEIDNAIVAIGMGNFSTAEHVATDLPPAVHAISVEILRALTDSRRHEAAVESLERVMTMMPE